MHQAQAGAGGAVAEGAVQARPGLLRHTRVCANVAECVQVFSVSGRVEHSELVCWTHYTVCATLTLVCPTRCRSPPPPLGPCNLSPLGHTVECVHVLQCLVLDTLCRLLHTRCSVLHTHARVSRSPPPPVGARNLPASRGSPTENKFHLIQICCCDTL